MKKGEDKVRGKVRLERGEGGMVEGEGGGE